MSLVRFRSEAPQNGSPKKSSAYAAVAHLVERHLAKVEVASSSLVGRSIGSEISLPSWWRGQVVRQRSAKPLFTSSNLVATSKTALDFGPGLFVFISASTKQDRGCYPHPRSCLFHGITVLALFLRAIQCLVRPFQGIVQALPYYCRGSSTEIPVSSRSCFAQAATYITANLSQEWL